MNRAYSVIEAKGFDEESRTFEGWATTPAPDRVLDTINPMKAVFAESLPLLHQHRHDAPIGSVTFGKPTTKGIPFTAKVANVTEPGPLRDRVETAWGEIKHGLVRAVSIGFRPITAPAANQKGGLDFDEIEIFELSSVTIPANAEAIITTVKSLDHAAMAEAGVLPEHREYSAIDGEVVETTPARKEIPAEPETPAATGKKGRVVKLDEPARDGAKPFVVRKIKRLPNS